jgi:hypothetical protein
MNAIRPQRKEDEMERPTIYLTKEQIYALVTVANDALVGVQIHTDDRDDTDLTCEAMQVDDPNRMCHFHIDPMGRLTDET